MFRVRLLLAAILLPGCALIEPLPPPSTLAERLSAFPRDGLPLSRPVAIHWDEHQIPYIEAESDRDLAVALGLVHAHLRLGQMEGTRRIAAGRLAEMGGPLATEIDEALRILDIGRVAPEIVRALPADTRDWVGGYVQGVNAYAARLRTPPHEFAVLGLKPEPWTQEDVIRIGRLVSIDVNWLAWFQLLKLREREDWPVLWAKLLEAGTTSTPSYASAVSPQQAALESLLAGLSKSGSNSLVVARERSATGGALIASDPHLGITIPNTWLIAGYKSPSYNAVGLMAPGLPFIALGRNEHIAWGGTNLRAALSDLFDVSALPDVALTRRTERIAVRWWFDRSIEARDTAYGPIVTDAAVLGLPRDKPLALRWMGHRPSDELSAMLGVNRARNWSEFRTALAGFALSPQSMLYADVDGRIGQIMAVHLPRRSLDAPADIVRPLTAARDWDAIVTGADLPAVFNPPAGFLASANNRPAAAEVPIGYFFSDNDRIERMQELLTVRPRVSVADLEALQRDVTRASARRLRDAILARPDALPTRPDDAISALANWNGDYEARSRGPVAFEAFLFHFVEAFYDEGERAAFEATGRSLDIIRADVETAPAAQLRAAFARALDGVGKALATYPEWGAMHRLALAHPLSFLPIVGARYRIADLPVAGSTTTLMKTAHAPTDARHETRYGSNARHISDLSDPDRNWFVLLGGQDGWHGSSTFLDQSALWREGQAVQVPLRPETARARFQHHMTLTP